jgi:hypothetical protein
MERIRDQFMQAVDTYGAESIEMEFRRKVDKPVYDNVIKVLKKSPHVECIGESTTREELGSTDARDVSFPNDEHLQPYTMYKKRLCSLHLDNVRLSVSLERQGEPDGVEKTIFRIKKRTSFHIDRTWRIDMTRVETNDPRYLDDDEYAYEMELELMTTSDGIYRYTIDHIMNWGKILMDEIYALASQ